MHLICSVRAACSTHFVALNFITPAICAPRTGENPLGGGGVGGSGAVRSVDSTAGQRAAIGDCHAYQLVIRNNMRMRIYCLPRRDLPPGG